MTLEDALNKALQILNTYSTDGVPISNAFNNQADLKLRLRGFANDAQQEIARTNGRITREFTIVTFENDIAFSTQIESVTMVHGGTSTFSGNGGHSYSINVSGSCTVDVSVGGNVVKSETVYPTAGQFVCVKGVVSNPGNQTLTITVSSEYDYLYKNVAIFKNKFPDDDSVREYAGAVKIKVPHDMIDLVQDRVLFNGRPSNEFRVYQRDVYLENSASGMWTLTYYAKPQEITSDTPLTYEFEVPAQIHNAIPYKMAYLAAIDITGVSASVLTAIKNEYAQQVSSVIDERHYRIVPFTNVYGD